MYEYVGKARTMGDGFLDKANELVESSSYKLVDGERGLVKEVPMSIGEEILACIYLFIFPGCMFWLPLVFLAISSYLCYTIYLGISLGTSITSSLTLLTLLITNILFLTLTRTTFTSSLYTSSYALTLLRYFSFKLIFEDEPAPKRNYIFIGLPHGVLPFGNFLSMITTYYMSKYPLRGLASDAAFFAPVFRQFCTWFGCVSASKSSALEQLSSSQSIGIAPDGVAGIFHTNSKDQIVFIQKRKGFVRLAIETGTPLVPTYIFGNTDLFNVWYDEGGFFKQLSRMFGFGLIILWGRFGLPIMKRVPLSVVLGTPLEVVQNSKPSKEYVEAVHEQFLVSSKQLFDKYKGYYGWEDKQIIFV